MIVPCYNQAVYLPEAIASVVAQSYTNWEIVIVNDGSTDETTEVAESLVERFPGQRIRLVEKENGGLSSARNAGIEAASGKYILPWLGGRRPDDKPINQGNRHDSQNGFHPCSESMV